MGKYNWNVDKLIERLNLIEKLISIEKDDSKILLLKRDYYNLQSIIEDEFNTNIYDKMKLLESYIYIKDDLQSIEFLWDDFKNFNNTVNEPIVIPELKRNSLSKEDLLTITHDFYKSLNKCFFYNFMNNFSKRNDHILFKSYSYDNAFFGQTIGIPSLNESFIEVYREYTNEDILTTIHEYSHATSLSINPNNLNDNKSLYSEIDTLFMELIASDYISKLFKDNTNIFCKSNNINDHMNNADDIRIMINTIEGEKYTENGYLNNKMLKNIASKYFNIMSEDIDDVIGEPILTNTIYLTSYMFALELYNQYKDDKEKTLYNLKKIILLENMNEFEYYNNIQKLGIIPNFSLENHYRKTKEEVLKLTRKK